LKDRAGWRLLLKRLSLSCLSLLLIFSVDRLLKMHYYSKVYRYYDAGEVYVEDENTLLLFSRHRYLFWKLKPNIKMTITEDPLQYDLHALEGKPGTYTFTVQTNSRGFNSPEISTSKPAGTVRLITLGDSRTMAEGIPFDKLYGRRLEAMLNESLHDRRTQVINAGVSGYSSYQGLVSLKREMLEYDPDYVTILFGINDQDADQGLGDRERAVEYDTPLNTIRGWANRSMIYYFCLRQSLWLRGIVVGKTPLDAQPEFRDGQLIRRVSLEEYEDNLNEFVDLGETQGFAPIFLIVPTSPYSFYPSLFEETLSSLDPDLLTRYRQTSHLYGQGAFEEAARILERILEEKDHPAVHRGLGMTYLKLGRDDEAHAHFVAMNEKIIFNSYAEVVRLVARERAVRLVDLTPEFTDRTSEQLYVDDMHPSEYGHELIARKIAEEGLITEPSHRD